MAATRTWAAAFMVCALIGCTRSDSQPEPKKPQSDAGSDALGTERPPTLVFGFTPYLSEEKLREEYLPLVRYVGHMVGREAEMRVADSYGHLSELLRNNEVHVAILSPFNYVEAKAENRDLVLLATPIAGGSPTYSAYIIAAADSDVMAIEDLQGKRFGFVDERSTSGYLYPMAYLLNRGIEPSTYFGEVVYTGNHASLAQQVLAGDIHAGATFAIAFEIAEDERIRILAKPGRIPFEAYCANPRLAPDIIESLQKNLLALSTRDETGRRVLRHTHINGFVAVSDSHYDEIRNVAATVKKAKLAAAKP